MTKIIDSIDSENEIAFADIQVGDKVARVKGDAITILNIKQVYHDRVVTPSRTVFDDSLYSGSKFYLLERAATPMEKVARSATFVDRPFSFAAFKNDLERMGLLIVEKES